jgi:hypothetical protein
LTTASLLDPEDGDGLILPGALVLGAGGLWTVLAAVLIEPQPLDLTVRPALAPDAVMLGMGARF